MVQLLALPLTGCTTWGKSLSSMIAQFLVLYNWDDERTCRVCIGLNELRSVRFEDIFCIIAILVCILLTFWTLVEEAKSPSSNICKWDTTP